MRLHYQVHLQLGLGSNQKTINTDDTILISGNSSTSYLSFDNNYTSLYSKIGMNNGDMTFQNYDNNFIFKDTNGNEIWKVNQSGNVLNPYNLTISGILQSPQTSLLSVSSNNIYNTQTNIIGVSIPNVSDKVERIINVSSPHYLTNTDIAHYFVLLLLLWTRSLELLLEFQFRSF